MAGRQPLVRASDLGLWDYCQRAWWLARVKGVAHQRPQRLTAGVADHAAHGRAVTHTQQQRQWSGRLIGAALILAGLALLLRLLGMA